MATLCNRNLPTGAPCRCAYCLPGPSAADVEAARKVIAQAAPRSMWGPVLNLKRTAS